jgi:hypothetical protein
LNYSKSIVVNDGSFSDDTEVWQITDNCGTEYERPIVDSSEYLQAIGFVGYPLVVEVRSAKDPHLLFGRMTYFLYELDNSPGGQIAAGVILLLFAVAMILMSLYKTYRFLIKYTFPNYLRNKRKSRYY